MFENREVVELMKAKKPAIFVTAHIGPWQVAPLVTKYYDLTINTIYAPESNPVIADIMHMNVLVF